MNNEAGQAVLIVLLSMVVALTAVLSVIASSTSDIKVSTNEETSQRAFSAAEAGVEKALITNSASQGSLGIASFDANITGLSQNKTNFVWPVNIANGEAATFWFVAHAPDGTLTCGNGTCFYGHTIKICWGTPGTPSGAATTPAIEVSTYYLSTPGSLSTAKTITSIYDPNGTRRISNFYGADDGGGCTIGNTSFAFHKQFDLATLGVPASSYGSQNGLQFMPVRMLYNTNVTQSIGIDVSGNTSTLPTQGNLVDSTGSLSTSSRKVEVAKAYNSAPPVFETAIFSPSSLSQ